MLKIKIQLLNQCGTKLHEQSLIKMAFVFGSLKMFFVFVLYWFSQIKVLENLKCFCTLIKQ